MAHDRQLRRCESCGERVDSKSLLTGRLADHVSKGYAMDNQVIAKKLAGKGGAGITRQYLRDAKSMNPIKRIKAIRALTKVGK